MISMDDKETKGFQTETIPLYEYVCMPRPHFEYEAENRALDDDELDDDELDEKYKKEFDENKHLIFEPARDHPEWKWVIMWEGYKTFTEYQRRSRYCDPDNFGMYIYNDFAGYGLQELMENLVSHIQTVRGIAIVLMMIGGCLQCFTQKEGRRCSETDLGNH
jgi:hypothetical protein